MTRVSFGKWFVGGLMAFPSKIREFHRANMKALEDPETWDFICWISAALFFPVVVGAAVFSLVFFNSVVGFVTIPIMIFIAVYSWYRADDPQESATNSDNKKQGAEQ